MNEPDQLTIMLDDLGKENTALRAKLEDARKLLRETQEHRDSLASRLLDAQKVNAVAREVLEDLHAEVKIWGYKTLKRINDGLNEGISTVPNSLSHADAKVGVERLERALFKAEQILGMKQHVPDTSILDRILEPLDQFAASVGYGIPPALTYFPQREEDYKAGYFGCKAQLKIELMHIRADAEKEGKV